MSDRTERHILIVQILNITDITEVWSKILHFFWNHRWLLSEPGVMARVLEYGVEVSQFILQSHYYVHLRTNTLGKGMNFLIPKVTG